MLKIREYKNLKKVLGSPFRSRNQVNSIFHSDCEILKLSQNSFLTTSIDALGEEISSGLYRTPEAWAWICISNSVGDLAASGTQALGISLSTEWKFGTSPALKKKFFKGIHQACKQLEVPFLGGDSGSGKEHVFTSSIIGQSTWVPLQRSGAKAGDFIVLHHQKNFGIGPSLALAYLHKHPWQERLEKSFRPKVSWKLSQKLRPFCHAAIDTSDGLLTSLLILSEINQLGFQIQWSPEVFHPLASTFCKKAGIHPLLLWFGDLGDDQILYVVPKKHLAQVMKNKNLTILGQFQSSKKYQLKFQNKLHELPMKWLQKIPSNSKSYKSFWKKVGADLNRSLSAKSFQIDIERDLSDRRE